MKKILVYFSLLMMFSYQIGYAADVNCPNQQCLAIVDAGSTGSRVHIYAFDRDETDTPVNIKEIWSNKVKPGFASLASDKPTIDNYLTKLLQDTPYKNLKLYFYSTAGMRLLPANLQQKYYQNLKQWFSEQSSWQLLAAKTISGQEEGLYDWLAVNYQKNTLKNPDDLLSVMDVGGASTQIAVPIDPSQNIANAENIRTISLYGKEMSIFVHSFLGLGQNEVIYQFMNTGECFAQNYPLPNQKVASGNAFDCTNKITGLVNNVHQVDKIVQSSIKNNANRKWVTLGAPAFLIKDKPFNFNKTDFSLGELLQQAHAKVCRESWDTLTSQDPNNEYLYSYCIAPAYYYALMINGYGISPDESINTVNSDWSLGVVLANKGA